MDDKTAKFDTAVATAKQLEEVKASLQKEMEDRIRTFETNEYRTVAGFYGRTFQYPTGRACQ